MNASRTIAAEICPDDEVLRSLLEVYLALRSLGMPPELPLYSAAEEAGRILVKNGIVFKPNEDGGLNISRAAKEI